MFTRAGYGVVSAQIFMSHGLQRRSKCCGKIILKEGTSVSEVIKDLNG
jgi:hypothetical protein